MNDKTLRIGLAGFGHWAREAYAPALLETDAARVTDVAAHSESSRAAAADTFGPDVRTHADFRGMIAEADIDAVMVSLPGEYHAEAILAAVEAGRHVFFEPPVALTRKEAETTLDRIEGAATTVQADLELRYLPVMEAAAERVAAGRVGAVRLARVTLWCDWGRDGALAHFGDIGFAYALGPWYLDVLDAVIGHMPRKAAVTGGYARNGPVLDHGWLALTYDNNAVGCFEVNLLAPEGNAVRLHVTGGAGEIEADLLAGSLTVRDASGKVEETTAPPSLPKCGFVGMRECIVDFLRCAAANRPARTTPAVIRRVQEAMLLCQEADPMGATHAS